MNRSSDFMFAFITALLLHLAAGYCAGSLLGMKVGIVQPLFKTGESSVEVTLLPPVVRKKIEVEEMLVPPPLEEDLPPLQVIKEQEKPEDPIEEEQNSDLLEKGVEAEEAPHSQTQIRPEYPYGSRIRGEEGVVVLSAVLDGSGRAMDVEVVTSSGFRSLDRAAVKAMKKAQFISDSGGELVGEEVDYTFRFQLKE